MAHFYGEIEGKASTVASRIGTKNSGMIAHIRGWDKGVKIVVKHVDNKDVFEIYETGGSKRPYSVNLISRIEDNDDE